MLTEKEKLDALTRLGIELSQVNDLDILMEHVLREARYFVNADAGSIYIRDEGELHFSYTQNDTLQKRLQADEKLIYSTFTIPIDEKSIAGYVASTGRPLNIADVYQLDSALPYHFSKKFDETSNYTTRTVFTLPLKTARGVTLGILQIINAQNDEGQVVPFSESDEQIMAHFASVASVALERAQMTRSMILRMVKMAELRDPKETGAHVNRVAGYAVEFYERWGRKRNLPRKEIDSNRDTLRIAAMLHDVGKVAIADAILKKPGRFTPEEREIMKRHAVLGARLFVKPQSEFDDAASQVALNHHERWDGTEGGYPGHISVATGAPIEGYEQPDGSARPKKGEEIPIFGRIVALVDVYDALCSARVYKEAWDEEDALDVIRKESGKQFDPTLVDIFFSILGVIHSIRDRYVEEE